MNHAKVAGPMTRLQSRMPDVVRRGVAFLDGERMLPLRYGLVAGVVGLPVSILQLAVILYVYERFFGGYNTLTLNALWLFNFELGLLRNFVLHCWYTWRMEPTWLRLRHAHVAAAGALVIDLAAFNAIIYFTAIVPLAQVFGAGAGFGFNYGYNTLKTFSTGKRPTVIEQVAP